MLGDKILLNYFAQNKTLFNQLKELHVNTTYKITNLIRLTIKDNLLDLFGLNIKNRIEELIK